MNMTLLGWIFSAAVAQGLFLVVALAAMRVRNTQSRWFLVGAIGVFTLILGEEFMDMAGLEYGLGIGRIAEFAIGPLLYLFVAALAEDDPTPVRKKWPHFVPLAIAIAWYGYLHLTIEGSWLSLGNPQARQFIAATVVIKAVYFAVYAVFILRRPLALTAKPDSRKRALRWVRRWMWFVIGAYFLGGVSFLAFYLYPGWAVDSDLVSGLILVAAIYSLGYLALVNRNVFDVALRRRAAGDGGSHRELADAAARRLDEAGLHLDPEFDLRTLAATLGVGEARLSVALNACIDGGFYALLNDRRLDHFRRLINEPGSEERTVLELAYASGFNSKATFYRYFRAREGTTPRAFRRALRETSRRIPQNS